MSIVKLPSYSIYINQKDALKNYLKHKKYSKIGIVVDENTKKYCLPKLDKSVVEKAVLIELKSGEQYKTIESCQLIWQSMLGHGFDRKSLLINLGGGVIGDMGGFCAATFMRGIDFIQVPTTLLAQVDASVGGKLAVDLKGAKNMVGLFVHPKAVIVETTFLETLPASQLRSGYAEMIKHGLISDASLMNFYTGSTDFQKNITADIIIQNIRIKAAVVTEDFKESGLRKILNFGHTIGHAVESQSFSTDDPLLHGEAIAIGMITESYLSHKKTGLSNEALSKICSHIIDIFDHNPNYVSDHKSIIDWMLLDKKNAAGIIKCSLLPQIGKCVVDISCDPTEIIEALDFYARL